MQCYRVCGTIKVLLRVVNPSGRGRACGIIKVLLLRVVQRAGTCGLQDREAETWGRMP